MSKKSFVIFLVLSVVVTYGVAITEGLMNNHFLGYGGVPFTFATGSFLGGSTDNFMFFIDIIFWFIILFAIWKLMKKLLKR
ncbi:MAG: hypothetical protein Q7R97_04375 [Candidatus Daviesbacteria bacterium]|nr:hypothetical protein [Candidatus Daviesbacteria bacterium]